ncbi:MAG: di-heme oxidoredictase family protein [Planctomycetota bacterium]|nr:di-heme oxidoredictase family protein [Planctomycetota bacterium]
MKEFLTAQYASRILAPLSILLVLMVGYRIWAKRITPEKILAGQVLFEHEWTRFDSLSHQGDGLGPVFNDVSCVACHFQGGVGGAGPNSKNVQKFTVLPTQERKNVYRGVIHKEATHAGLKEDFEQVAKQYPVIRGETVRKGCYTVREPDLVPVISTSINTPALFGLGLIEKIPDYTIAYHGSAKAVTAVANELRGKFSSRGIGRVKMSGTRVGKFGWQGEFGTIEEFVAEACAVELGLSVPGRRQDKAQEFTEDRSAKYDLNHQQLHELVCFVKSLPRPQQRLPTDPEEKLRATQGEKVFQAVGCADCHVPDMGGVDGIYSDFHLYKLTSLKSDGYDPMLRNRKIAFPFSETAPNEWKTPPLWGVADSAPYFHDGSAETLKMAIDLHRGDAEYSRQKFKESSPRDQTALVAFLKTLRAPQSVAPFSGAKLANTETSEDQD